MSVLFVAEIGSAHKGIPALAYEMIRQSKLAGADIAKFQIGWPESDEMRHMPTREISQLMAWCRHFDIEFMASIWSQEALVLAHACGMKRAKVSSQVASSKPELAWAILETPFEEVFISCLASDYAGSLKVRRIQVVSQYPTYPGHFRMENKFGKSEAHYGYSSHVHGIEDALLAIARGACYVEKHVTLDKTETNVRDNHFALSFEEFRDMVKYGRGMARLI